MNSLFCIIEANNFELLKNFNFDEVKINQRNEKGFTALQIVTCAKNLKSMKLLLTRGADPNIFFIDTTKDTLLHCLTLSSSFEMMKILVEFGADVNAKNNSGHTPLHYAMSYGSIKNIQFLLEHKADLNAKNEFGNTPLQIAKMYHQDEAIQCVKKQLLWNCWHFDIE